MAEVYTINISPVSRQELLGGRVGNFLLHCGGAGGPYFLGDSSVDNTTGFEVTDTFYLYVTSPDEIYVYNQSAGTTASLKIFHNR